MGRLKGNNLPAVKRQNEALIKEVVYKYAPISRSEIAEMLSLTPPTITTNISLLLKQGLLEECTDSAQEEEHALGRPPVKLNFVENAYYVIGVEVHPYQTVITLLNLRGKEQSSARYPTENTEYQNEIRVLAEQIRRVLAESGIAGEKILGIGVGIPGFVKTKTGTVRKSILRSWNEKPIARGLSELTGLPVLVENNARVRAVGEELFGRELRPDTFAYFLISYGIACPLYVRNSILEGEQQEAGEAGHMVAVLNGPRCATCGNDGCLEEVASERAVLKLVKEAIREGKKTKISDYCKTPESITIREVLKAQAAGDELADQIIGTAITYLGAMLANIINLVNPPLVIVDAFMMEYQKNREDLLKETQSHIFGLYDEEVKIEFTAFSPYSGARGAAALAVKHFLLKGIL